MKSIRYPEIASRCEGVHFDVKHHGFWVRGDGIGAILYRTTNNEFYEMVSYNFWIPRQEWMRLFYDAAYDFFPIPREIVAEYGFQFLRRGGILYTPKTKLAMKLCFEAHKDQVDKSGMPYVFHPFHLAEQMEDENTTVVALLHDVVEDTDYTLDDLCNMGFGDEVMAALMLMTHDKTVPYMEYVAKIKENPIARVVKLADLKHNSDMTRLDTVDDSAMERVAKYAKAIAVLEG